MLESRASCKSKERLARRNCGCFEFDMEFIQQRPAVDQEENHFSQAVPKSNIFRVLFFVSTQPEPQITIKIEKRYSEGRFLCQLTKYIVFP